MNDRARLIFPLLLVLTATLAGCSKKSENGGGGPNGQIANGTGNGGPRDAFEAAKGDPPIAADTHFAAATYAEEVGHHARAADLYRSALKREPKHLGAMYRLGVVHAKLQQHDEAIALWKRYVKATGESAEAYSNLAYAYELAGLPDDAEAAYGAGIDRDAKNVPCRVNYGLMLARRGDVTGAVVQLRAVLDEADVHYNLASVHELQGRTDQARLEYRKALELDPQFRDAQARLDAIE